MRFTFKLSLGALVAAVVGHIAPVSAVTSTQNDLNVLNYALSVEQFEATFYNFFLPQFSDADFVAAGYPAGTYTFFQVLQSHENTHVSFIRNTILSLGGTPVPVCQYDFTGVTNVIQFVQYSDLFSNTGVRAYDGGLNAITSPTYQEVAATIATVEGRHAAVLNELVGLVPFPDVTEYPAPPSQIYANISAFTISCATSTPLTLPVVRSQTSDYVAPTAQNSVDDITTLNYALTLEHLEATFYTYFQSVFTAADFTAAGFPASAYNYLSLIESHEQAHVTLLTTVITSLGGTPVPACNYTFPVNTVADYLKIAALLENTGVSAYDGAANTITSTALQQAAATIATVEGRHAAYLNQLNKVFPFGVFDTALPASAVISAAGPFFVSCPVAPVGPTPNPAGPQGSFNIGTNLLNGTVPGTPGPNAAADVVGTNGTAATQTPTTVPASKAATTSAATTATPTTSAATVAPTTAVPTTAPNTGAFSVPSFAAPATVAPTATVVASTTGAAATAAATAATSAPVTASSAPVTSNFVTAASAQGNSSTPATGNSAIGTLAVCNVIDPTRIEYPWHGSLQGFPQFYDTSKYVCVDANFLCPTTAPSRCGYGCYTQAQYSCVNGQLVQN